MSSEFNVTVEAILAHGSSYHDAVAKLVVRESRLQKQDETTAMITTTKSEKKCFFFGKRGHLMKDCYKKKRESAAHNNQKETRKCFKCGKKGHIAKNCKKNEDHNDEDDDIKEDVTAVITQPLALVTRTSRKKTTKWILDSGCTRHICNNKDCFEKLTEETGRVQVGNNQ